MGERILHSGLGINPIHRSADLAPPVLLAGRGRPVPALLASMYSRAWQKNDPLKDIYPRASNCFESKFPEKKNRISWKAKKPASPSPLLKVNRRHLFYALDCFAHNCMIYINNQVRQYPAQACFVKSNGADTGPSPGGEVFSRPDWYLLLISQNEQLIQQIQVWKMI